MQLYAPAKYLKKIPNQARSRETVSAIIQASAQIVVKTGHQSLTTENIARVAGVSVGSIYQYFETKDDIILAMLMEAIAAFHQKIQSLLTTYAEQPYEIEAVIPVLVDAIIAVHGDSPESAGALIEYLAMEGTLQAVETLLRDLEAWAANFMQEQGLVNADCAALRARSLVHGICAVMRITLRYAPETIHDAAFREELIRLFYLSVFGELPEGFIKA